MTLGAIVAALVAKAGDHALATTVEAGDSALRRVVDRLRQRFADTDDEKAAAALEVVERAPDATVMRELAAAVDRHVATDVGLAAELEEFVKQARAEGVDVDSINQVAWGDHNVQIAEVHGSQINIGHPSQAWATTRAGRKARVDFVDVFSTQPSAPQASSSSSRIPSQSSPGMRVEVVDIDIPTPTMCTDPPVVDVKLHNAGDETAILKRMTVEVLWAKRFTVLDDLQPSDDYSGFVMMPPSATYEVRLPTPEQATGARIATAISQVIAPGDADRFQVLLKAEAPGSATVPYLLPGATFVYLLRLELLYNATDQRVSSRVFGVGCPGNILWLPTVDALRIKIRRFEEKVGELRQAVDEEIAARALAPPDWTARARWRREDLPAKLSALDGGYGVNDRFWDPQRAIARYLDEAESVCRELVDSLTADMPDGLAEFIPKAQASLAEIPQLREQLGVSGPGSP